VSNPFFDIFDSSPGSHLAFTRDFNDLQTHSRLQALALAVLLFKGGSDMFRISTIDTSSERRLVLEGTLVRPWVDELRRTWSVASKTLEGRGLVIDLTNVIVISREGENTIFELMKEGAKFSCGGVLTRHLLKELAHRCNCKLSSVLNQKCSKGGKI